MTICPVMRDIMAIPDEDPNWEIAAEIVSNYSERDILDYALDFYKSCSKASELIDEDETVQAIDSDVFIKLHVFGLIKNGEPELLEIWKEYRTEVEYKKLNDSIDDIDEPEPEPEY